MDLIFAILKYFINLMKVILIFIKVINLQVMNNQFILLHRFKDFIIIIIINFLYFIFIFKITK